MKLIFIFFWNFFITYSSEEIFLFNKINDYRKQNGLESIKLCDSLSFIAKLHTENIYENHDFYDKTCGLHTWYPSSKYSWVSGCYGWNPPYNGKVMWFKPKEILGMKAIGYEIAHIHFPKNQQCNSDCCLKNWKESDGHNKTILQIGWKRPFKRMGISIYKGVSTVWFASE